MLAIQSAVARLGAVFALGALLAGCEAPLVLDGVLKMRQQPIHRMDRYQASARIDDKLVVVGNQGVVLRSSGNGGSWQRLELAGWPALIDVAACPDGRFVALAYDQKIYVSTDHGADWVEHPIETEETPQSVTCAPDDRIWVVGSYTSIWSSADSGATWHATTQDEDAIYTTVHFFDAHNGIITGEFGMALRTTDGGATWEALPPLPDEFYPQEAYWKDMQTGWIIGLGGSVLHTTDGGNSWAREETGTQVSLFGIEEVGGRLYIVGGEGTMLAYHDGRWQSFAHGKPIRLYLRGITALDGRRCLISGVGGALHIVDVGGA